MVSVTDEVKQAFLNRDGIRLEIVVSDGSTLGNDDIIAGSMKLEQTLCDEEQIVYGSVGSACFTIQIVNTGVTYVGKTFTPTMYADVDGDDYGIQLGVFTVTEDERSDNRQFRNITAYDVLSLSYEKDVSSWYSSLTFPITIKAMRDSLFSFVGITQEEVSLCNDDITVEHTIDPEEEALTFQQMLFYICEINGALGCMTSQNLFRYVTPDLFNDALYPADNLYPADDIYPKDPVFAVSTSTRGDGSLVKLGSYAYKEYNCQEATAVTIKEDSADYGTTYGTDGNVYAVVGNILCLGNDSEKNREIALNLYVVLSGVYYTPSTVIMLGMPWVELGDYVQVVSDSKSLPFPILHRTMTGIKNCEDAYDAKGTEYYLEKKANVNAQIQQLRSRTLKLTATVDEVSSELTEEITRATGAEESLSSSITQTVEQIQSEVTRATQAEGNLSSRITQNASNIELRVEKNGVISSINQSSESITINASKINLQGYVTMTDLSTSGSTTINGANITTGTINCDLLNGGTISGQTISGGTITGTSISGGTLSIGDNFNVTNNGQLTAKRANITGSISAGDLYIDDGIIEFETSNSTIEMNSSWTGYYSGDGIRISSEIVGIDGRLLVRPQKGSGTYYVGVSQGTYVEDIEDNGDGTITWYYRDIVNGICI